jgi:LacI family transcriptional regulator
MANSITLQDVAQLAGVSMGTASQALNNRPNVAPETRSRVVDAAMSLGYPVKEPDSELQDVPLDVVGLLVKHDVGLPPEVNPFYAYIQAGAERACQSLNLSLMYANIEVDPSNHPVEWPAMIREQRIDGLILAGTFIEDTIDLFKRHIDAPVVLVDSYAPNLPFDSVVIDNGPAACAAVNYLIELGHRHIGLVGVNEQSPPGALERREGYLKALQAHTIQEVYIESSRLDRGSGYEATQRLLRKSPQITAIFACNDLSAIGAIHAARDMGLQVPEDLSVVGFDNIDVAKEITPPLTTIHVHKTWMGMLGVRQLLLRAQSPDQPKITIVVSTQLIARDSARIHAT